MTDQPQINVQGIISGSVKALTRAISLASNFESRQDELPSDLPNRDVPVIGITGPPGAGKSTLTDALIGEFVKHNKKIAVLCVDPSSPFTHGAILGDRIRMSEWYTNPNVFIRSVATRGSLGGLPPLADKILTILKAAPFDYIFIETVGVGQSEIEIAKLAHLTIVVLVPESGDGIQFMKAGLLEIGDFYVVNKSDRPGADMLLRDIQLMLRESPVAGASDKQVFKTIANTRQGASDLAESIINYFGHGFSGSGS